MYNIYHTNFEIQKFLSVLHNTVQVISASATHVPSIHISSIYAQHAAFSCDSHIIFADDNKTVAFDIDFTRNNR